MTNVSVVIPAYNEQDAIAQVVNAIQNVFAPGAIFEIIVVNDGSTDHTEERARTAGARVITNPVNMGYGFSLKRGFLAAQYECLVITDADGTYPIDQIPTLITTFEKGFDMVVGARQGSFYWSSAVKGVARKCFKWMSEYVVGKKIPDINSGFRAIRRSLIIPVLPDLSNTFSFSTSSTLIFMLKKYFVTYIPIAYHRRTGRSKVKHVRDALIATQIMTEIIARYNPIKLFLLAAAVPCLIACILAVVGVCRSSGLMMLGALVTFVSAWCILSLGFVGAMFRKS